MKISDYNDGLSLLANIGVIAGIFFLAFELQQNTNIARANAYQQLNQDLAVVREWLVSDPVLDELYRKYQIGQSRELDEQEIRRISTIVRSMIAAYDNAYYFYTLGVISESEWRRFFVGACFQFRSISSDDRLRRIPISEEFTDFMRSAIEQDECTFSEESE